MAAERRRRHGRQQTGGINRNPIVTHLCGGTGKHNGAVRIMWTDHRPAVAKDLRPDLLGHNRPIQGDRTALRRRNTRAQPLKCRLFASARYPYIPSLLSFCAVSGKMVW